MTIIDIITQILGELVDLVLSPLRSVLEDYGSGVFLDQIQLKLGFGSVEWFNFYLVDLIVIVFGLVFGVFILRLIYRFIKWLFRLGKGIVGIR